jgi:flagellar biosynthesis protein
MSNDKGRDGFSNSSKTGTNFQRPSQAVALYYDGQTAPKLTAKGENELADEIVAIAEAFQVPTFKQSDLAQLLYKLDLNEEIPQALYVTVAEILSLAYILEGRTPGETHRPVRTKPQQP